MPGLTIGAGVTVNMGGNVCTNAANGVNPTDLATVGQITGGTGIAFATANSGTWLGIEATDSTGAPSGYAISVHDSASVGNGGILVLSDNGGITLEADNAAVTLFGTVNSQLSVGLGVSMQLDSGSAFTMYNSTGSTVILATDEATGVTTGSFDGGSA